MQDQFLYQQLDSVSSLGLLNKEIPMVVSTNLNPNFHLREYQKEAFARFFYYISSYPKRAIPSHILYNMATGSGKTYIMAGLILYLYAQGYRNILFFVNSNNIINKTKANFLDANSSKYLFNDKIIIANKIIGIKEVTNFTANPGDDICIKFTTIHGLHTDLNIAKENSITYEDFQDTKIVMLSDEAHHINADTKSTKNTEENNSWEKTVMNVFNTNKDNILLEFTATLSLDEGDMLQKYKDKIIYKYDLKEFRLDGYSKDVDILKSDMDMKDRILQALLLSQYRLKIAEKYKIYCKPVILFKSQQTIAESEQNKVLFHQIIHNLKEQDISSLINKASDDSIMSKAYAYFANNKITSLDLARELQQDFAPEYCISANDDKEAEKNQILLNTLEDNNNRIRAVFAVQKLNEGWDVLNLFDIVRLYDTRDGDWKKDGNYYAGKTTNSEAQLIGRGARYFPFETDEALGEDKYKRKFDKTNHELKVLETFYYHTSYDNKYIAEITQALREIGIMNEKEQKKFTLKIKDQFLNNPFYKEGYVYVNSRIAKGGAGIDSLKKAGINQQRFTFTVKTNQTGIIHVFEEKQAGNENIVQGKAYSMNLKDIPKRIIRKALRKNDFYAFDNLQKFFGSLTSMEEFISDDAYLANLIIDVLGGTDDSFLNNYDYLLQITSKLLSQLESQIKNTEIQYEGTKEFRAKAIHKIFEAKKDMLVDIDKEAIGYDAERFVFDKIIGSSEEKGFMELFHKKIGSLQTKYDEIYLFRSERAFPIYSFKDGQRFEPDFVLFLKEKAKHNNITYQVFIEPKGTDHLEYDKRKEDFLLEISSEAEIIDLNFGNYRLVGLPFYNKTMEIEFEKSMDKVL